MRVIFISLVFIALQGNSQTVINYQTWTGATGCNIFALPTSVPATIDGNAGSVIHQCTIGQPTYDAATHAVDLDGNIQGGANYLGTEYRIGYNFVQGNSYSITINAVSINGTGGFPNLRLK